jgi:hypothetical protein
VEARFFQAKTSKLLYRSDKRRKMKTIARKEQALVEEFAFEAKEKSQEQLKTSTKKRHRRDDSSSIALLRNNEHVVNDIAHTHLSNARTTRHCRRGAKFFAPDCSLAQGLQCATACGLKMFIAVMGSVAMTIVMIKPCLRHVQALIIIILLLVQLLYSDCS